MGHLGHFYGIGFRGCRLVTFRVAGFVGSGVRIRFITFSVWGCLSVCVCVCVCICEHVPVCACVAARVVFGSLLRLPSPRS